MYINPTTAPARTWPSSCASNPASCVSLSNSSAPRQITMSKTPPGSIASQNLGDDPKPSISLQGQGFDAHNRRAACAIARLDNRGSAVEVLQGLAQHSEATLGAHRPA